MGTRKICRDCTEEGITTERPAGWPGPRCWTHHYVFKQAQKGRNHERYVQRTYGLAPGEYEELYAFQGGRCPICLTATGTGAKKLAVDHDHVTGRPRGLLNARCNHDLLGFFDLAALERAVEYLRNPPYERMCHARMAPSAELPFRLSDAADLRALIDGVDGDDPDER